MGRELAERDITLVYGGARVGLMGVLADATLEADGAVVGVITEALVAREVAHTGLTELIVVKSMHERKAHMADRSGAFIMLPGGFGTLDEFFEAVTWTQLGIHDKPCGVLDVAAFFQPLSAFFQTLVAERFVDPDHAQMVVVEADIGHLLDRLESWQPIPVDKRLDRVDR